VKKPTAGRERAKLFEALQHPLRREALAYLQEHRSGSASEIARAIDAPLGHVSYHVRTLAELGLIEEIQRVQRRGAMMRVFQTTSKFRDAMVGLLSEEIVRLAAIAYPDIGPSAIALLDEQALGELAHDMDRVFARVDELRAQTATRATRSRSPLPTVATACCSPSARRRREHTDVAFAGQVPEARRRRARGHRTRRPHT
jgi:DNA-binding transcriptional ArsR family regulator